MKRTFKRFLSAFLVAMMLLTAVPLGGMTAFAESTDFGTFGDDFFWDFYESTGTLIISGIGEMYGVYYDYVDDYDGRPWKNYINSIRAVIIEKGVTTIGNWAFYNCNNLTSVEIPDSVTTIDNHAFRNCDSLNGITIPDSVTTIGDDAFYNCDSLTGITIPDSVTTIGYSAFNNCTSLTSVTIPDSVATIEKYTFYNCTSLTSVTIPDSVTTIGNWAFYNCNNLTSVEIPDSVTTIDNHAFRNCDSLNGITIPDSVTTIGSYAFYNCDSLADVIIGNGVTAIGDYAFYDCVGLTSVTIPDSVTTIGSYAFYNCDSLVSITIGSSVITIGDFAFGSCASLVSITIPDSVTTIGSYAFAYCDGLTSIIIGGSVITIDGCAFYDCDNLTSVIIPDSVTTIGFCAFYHCDGLASVTIGNSVTTIEGCAFESCNSLTSITIPASVTLMDNMAFRWCGSLANISVDGNNQYYSSDSYGVLYNKEKTELIQYPIGNERTEFTIPDSVTIIGDSAFNDCGNLTSVIIPASVTTIEDGAFCNCESLTSVTIPDSVTTIGYSAFKYCTSLSSVTIPDSVTAIENSAFKYCTSLSSVTIPDSVTTVEYYAFDGCISLTDVYFNGTEAEWNSISIAGYNEPLLNATIHFLGDAHTHIYTSSVTTPATCSREGVMTYTCSCGDSYTQPIPTEDHSWGEWTIITAPTATESGMKTRLCASCEATETVAISATGFDLADGVTIDFANNIISGLNAGATSLDGYTTTVDDSYVWTYETVNGNLGTGSTAVLKDGETVIGEYTVMIYGDTNGDSWYDGADSIIVSCLANGMLTQDDVSVAVYEAADCNHDGVIDALDVALLEQAGALLASVDQSKSTEELATDEDYIEYVELIDQTPDTQVEEPDEVTDGKPQVNIFEFIIEFIKTIFEMLLSNLPI